MSADPEQIEMTKHNTDNLSERMLRAFREQGIASDLKCQHKRTEHIGEDWTGKVWINVYRCKDCGKELI